MKTLYTVLFMLEGFETDYARIFANTAQEAVDKIRARKDVLDVFKVLRPVTEDWK